jgi:hypothetical protein
MTQKMTPGEPGTVADRIPRPGSGFGPTASRIPAHEEIVAGELTRHIAEGDAGAVRRFVHELEHGLGAWTVDPWRLLEHVAERLIGQRQPPNPGPESATQPQTGG